MQFLLRRYWVVRSCQKVLGSVKSAALLCSQHELSLESKSTATHVGTVTQYAWHDSGVLYALFRTPFSEFWLGNVLHILQPTYDSAQHHCRHQFTTVLYFFPIVLVAKMKNKVSAITHCGLKFASFFTLSDNKTRGHCFKIQKQYSRVNCSAFSFANRCIDAWNSLDNDVLCASSVQAFKRRPSLQNFTKFLYVS